MLWRGTEGLEASLLLSALQHPQTSSVQGGVDSLSPVSFNPRDCLLFQSRPYLALGYTAEKPRHPAHNAHANSRQRLVVPLKSLWTYPTLSIVKSKPLLVGGKEPQQTTQASYRNCITLLEAKSKPSTSFVTLTLNLDFSLRFCCFHLSVIFLVSSIYQDGCDNRSCYCFSFSPSAI